MVTHPSTADLDAALPHLRDSPADEGTLELIVRRPAVSEREVLDVGHLDLADGLVGDTWKDRPSKRMPGKDRPHPDMQLNLMNSRAVGLFAGSRDRWSLAGDQLYVDLDLSEANLPAGARLGIGDAVIEITDQPHTGCAKFAERFGMDVARYVNGPVGSELRLRGINAKVVEPGEIRAGDRITVTRPG